MQDILSHPNVKLEDHLKEVVNWGEFYKSELTCKLLDEIDDDILSSFFIFHDVGKSTEFFQKYIRNEKVESNLKSHALISAMLFLYYHILNKNIDKYEDVIVAMAYAILKHHGNLKEFTEIDNIITEDMRENQEDEILIIQYRSIKLEIRDKLIQLRLNEIVIEEIFNRDSEKFVEDLIKFFHKRRRRNRTPLRLMKKNSERSIELKGYFMIQFFYSLLIDSDKSQVALINRELAKRVDVKVDVRNYISNSSKKESELNKLRTKALKEVEDNLDNSSSIYTLTLPTGLGKTLNSFNFAFKLREKLYNSTNKKYRIIYVMPFMSIIDQNAKVLESVIKSELNISNDKNKLSHNILCKHHHLTEIEWITNENTLLDKNSSQMLIEGWNSEIVITTFWQFFTTLTGHKNATQRKFNKLCNSIVIIDEIQALPVKYYKFINYMLTEFTKLMDSKIIVMTATQPYIFDSDKSLELCDYVKYYKNLNRTKIINNFDDSKLLEEFVDEIEIENKKTYLFILNTIESCKSLFFLLKDKFYNKKITYLSTMLPPKERFYRIEKIKKNEFDIVVSTQLVEAGVDINFNFVYRDFAPLPMIFQSAGRGNREGEEQEQAKIYIVKLKDSNGLYCDKIYKHSKTELNITEKLLKDYDELNESEFMGIIEKYFREISDERVKSQHVSNALLEGAKKGWFYKEDYDLTNEILPMNAFELIDNDVEKFQVFIELDEHAKIIWKDYLKLIEDGCDEKDKWEYRIKIKDIQRQMAEYVVNINVSTKSKYNKPPMDSNQMYYYVCNMDIENFYNFETGYGVDTGAFYY